MPKFVVVDCFGSVVECSDFQWNDHIIKRHPEMIGRETAVADAIQTPAKVFEGNAPNAKAFQGVSISTGFWAGATPIAVVRYRRAEGFVVTAYLGSPSPDWRQIWVRA